MKAALTTIPFAAESNSVEIDLELIRRLEKSGPRYTSYPTADRFVEAFNANTYKEWVEKRALGHYPRSLSLYVHVPFCNTVCYYCACNKVITKDRTRSGKYVKYLAKEMAMQSQLFGKHKRVNQLHWGGGTPTFLPHEQMRELMAATRDNFELSEDGEYSIEIDPRKVEEDTVQLLAELGFNRMSIGVQDFDPQVQKAVNRIQSVAETQLVIDCARRNGFKSINIDLIYGLPKQTVLGFARTLDTVIKASPERIALYNYAHLPSLFKPQRRIHDEELPSANERMDIFKFAIRHLRDAGYIYIGMDHFAKPTDDLAIAQRQGRLHRNFQGYSTHADCDLVGFGISSIGKLGATYSQNVRSLDDYYDRLDRDVLPIFRGIELTADDLLRRTIIQALMCQFEISIQSLEIAHLIDFADYFKDELEDLRQYEQEGMLKLEPDWITVTPKGRLLIRTICMVFDKFLRIQAAHNRYSKVI